MLLYDTKYLQLKSTKSKSGNDWVYAHRPNAKDVVVILPLINNKQVLFLIEERPPLQAEGIAKYSIALPAGLVGDERIGETIEEAINAELMEEASSPGCISETVTIAIAYVNEYNIIKKPVSDGGVIVNRVLVDKNNIRNWLKEQEESGIALTASTLAALFYLNEV